MGERAVYNLIIGLYAPSGSGIPPAILNCSVPEPSASHLRDAIGGAQQEAIPGTILTFLAQGFQRADEISHNPATPAPEAPSGVPLLQMTEAQLQEALSAAAADAAAAQNTAIKDDLLAIAEGRKVVLIDDGNPIVVTPEEAAKLDLGQEGDSQFKTVTETDPTVTDHSGPSTDPAEPPEAEKHIDPITDAGAGKVIDEAPTEEVQGSTDGSVSGEK